MLAQRLAHAFIVGYGADVLQGDVQEAIGDLHQLGKQAAAFLLVFHHVGQYAEAADAVVEIEQSDKCVGVGN
ncbi:hypothetical protein D3C84_1208970 [compost metagenome]